MYKSLLLLALCSGLAQAAEPAPAKDAPAAPAIKPFFDPAAPGPTVDPTKDVPPPVIPTPSALPPEKKKKKK
ncbi:MAG: hypothetical protein WCJ96_00260 [Verrucomicrobiota bacterium]|jgi:hypothetical protein